MIALEAAVALGADAAQRVQDPVRAVHAVEEAVDLRAQLALAERVVGPAPQLDGDAALDGGRPAARVRAVVVARAVHDPAGSAVERHGPTLRRMASTRRLRSAPVTTTASNWAGNQRWLVAERVDAALDRRGRGRRAGGRSPPAAGSRRSAPVTRSRRPPRPTGSRCRSTPCRGCSTSIAIVAAVRVEAGIRLRALNDELADVGLALPNLGDIDRQSIAGAIATATHGTGLGLGNLATTVVGMEIVTGTGDVVRLDEHTDPELLRVARVGIGALGIVTEVTLQCVPAFRLHARETIEVLDDVLDGFAEQAAAVDHFELYWMPGGGKRCQVKRNRRTDEPARPQSRLAYARDKWIGENVGFGLVCRVGRRFPTAAPRIAKLVTSSAGERDLVDRSDRIFCSPRHVRFVEMEYGVPIEHLPEAVRRLRDFARHLPTPVLFPVEVRVSAADDIPLSTGFGRTSGWIAVHQYRGMPYEEYFAGVERIMDDYGGRPHWGKLHGQRAATLASRYPQWAEFQAARDKPRPRPHVRQRLPRSGARLTASAGGTRWPGCWRRRPPASFPPADGGVDVLPADPAASGPWSR